MEESIDSIHPPIPARSRQEVLRLITLALALSFLSTVLFAICSVLTRHEPVGRKFRLAFFCCLLVFLALILFVAGLFLSLYFYDPSTTPLP